MVLQGVVGGPHGGQAGSLGGHDVDAGAIVHGQVGHAGAEELHDGVLDGAVLEGGADKLQGHVLGTHAGNGSTGEVDGDDLGIGDVVGLLQQLPGQLGTALADGHGAVGAVAGVGVGAQDHLAGGGVPLSHVGVDDALVGGDELTAVLLGGGQTEDVVVLIDGAAHGAQGVVAVGEHIGERELLHTGGPGSLDDANIGDVMGGHGVKLDGEAVHGAAGVVGLQNGIGHGALLGFLRTGQTGGGALLGRQEGIVFIVDALTGDVQHTIPSDALELSFIIPTFFPKCKRLEHFCRISG